MSVDSVEALASQLANAIAGGTWQTRVGYVEGTTRAARDATALQTAARSWTSVAYATEVESPRAPVTATETCWTNAGYVQNVLMCEKNTRT